MSVKERAKEINDRLAEDQNRFYEGNKLSKKKLNCVWCDGDGESPMETFIDDSGLNGIVPIVKVVQQRSKRLELNSDRIDEDVEELIVHSPRNSSPIVTSHDPKIADEIRKLSTSVDQHNSISSSRSSEADVCSNRTEEFVVIRRDVRANPERYSEHHHHHHLDSFQDSVSTSCSKSFDAEFNNDDDGNENLDRNWNFISIFENDCDGSIYDSSDSLLTTESLDQILSSCERIRDAFDSENISVTTSGSEVRCDHEPDKNESCSKLDRQSDAKCRDHAPLFCECNSSRRRRCRRRRIRIAGLESDCRNPVQNYARLDLVKPGCQHTICADEGFKMDPWSSLPLKRGGNGLRLRSYASIAKIPVESVSGASKVNVRQKPELPAYVTLDRRKLKKSHSDPCEIAENQRLFRGRDKVGQSEIENLIAELDFSKFRTNDSMKVVDDERLRNLSKRPLLRTIERIGLRKESEMEGVQCEPPHQDKTNKTLSELTEKLKNQDLFGHRQRSHSISQVFGKTTDDFVKPIVRRASLPKKHPFFLRSSSFAGRSDRKNPDVGDESKTSTWSPGMFPSDSASKKDDRYMPLKGSSMSRRNRGLQRISSVPVDCPKTELLSKSDMSVDSAVESIISDDGLGVDADIMNSAIRNSSETSAEDNNSSPVRTRNLTSLSIQESNSGPSFAEKRKRRKGMVFNGNAHIFQISPDEPNGKSTSTGRSLTFPPQRKGSLSDAEPLYTSIDSNGMKSLNADNSEHHHLQVSELSLADSSFSPGDVHSDETYHDVVGSSGVKSTKPKSGKSFFHKHHGKQPKKKHYSDPCAEKCVNNEDAENHLCIPDTISCSKSEPELGNNSGNRNLKLHIDDRPASDGQESSSQPNSPPVCGDVDLFKSNSIGGDPLTAPIRFGFQPKFYSLDRPQQSKRYSKKRLRGPYGEMLEEEMRKSGEKQHNKNTTEKLSFLQELMEPPSRSVNSECVPDRRNADKVTSGQQRSVDDLQLQRSNSDMGATPKRKISTNIPPIPSAGDSTNILLAPSQLSPSISVPNMASVENTCEWSSGGEQHNEAIDCLKKYGDTRTHVVGELYETEKSYVESLQILVKRYYRALKSPENAHLVEANVVDDMFYQIPEILVHHEAFLDVLTYRLANWDSKQKVGDVFVDAFTKQPVIDTYTAFINNWKSAKEAIKTAVIAKPAFAKFLQHMSREHKGKLTLDALLIMPVQRIPRYELLIKELLKHTQVDHPDHHPLMLAQKEVHDLAVKINHMEREAQEAERMQQKLRDLENLIEGLIDLVQPDRTFIRYDYVTMAGGLGIKKERCLFLFSDLLIITSMKRKTGTIRKTSSMVNSTLASSTLEMNKYKLLLKFSFDDLDVTKNNDAGITKAMHEVETLQEDISVLGEITEMSNSLNIPHQGLDDVVRELLATATKQLAEKHSSDSVLLSLELTVTTQEGIERLTVLFPTPERRSTFEAAFDEAKQKLALTTNKRSPPEFLYPLPIRKTRAGLQFTCAAATIGLNNHDLKDVWVCNSDGYVGQVCILSLQPEPTVTSCNGVCNSRIMCIASIPAANSMIDLMYMRRRSTINADNTTGISISIENADDAKDSGCLKTNGNFQLDSESSDEDEDNEYQDEDVMKRNSELTSKDSDSQQPTMWLGTEDGYVHIYNCQDNIRIKKNKFKIQHGAAITCIIHLDNRVFVSLANGDLAVYSREKDGGWNTCEAKMVTIGNQNTPVNRMLAVAGKLWCGCQNNVIVVNTASLEIEQSFSICSDTSRSVLCMGTSGLGVWISIQNSAVIKLFHATSYECLFDVNVAPAVTKMLSGCDDIIRQHKAACLRVISLLTCKDLLWVGTSAGVLLTIPTPHLTSTSTKITSVPNITGIPHGHTGHVRFLTGVEMSPSYDSKTLSYNSNRSRYTRRSVKSKEVTSMRRQSTSAAMTTKLLVISGGDGYEDFRNNSANEVAGRDDSTNHLLLWHV
ncbi:ARHGEF17 (predicted) [Pycnogonum litorale]